MGWWTTSSSRWEMAIVAQMGGAAGFGAAAFFLQFRSPDLPVKPVFLAIAGGVGIGGSVGSTIGIPYSAIIRQMINPQAVVDTNSIGFSALDGTFNCEQINHALFSTAQAQASVVVVGVQAVAVNCEEARLLGPNIPRFSGRITLPRNLRQVGQALLDLPQIQGGLGAGVFAFTGPLQYIGVS